MIEVLSSNNVFRGMIRVFFVFISLTFVTCSSLDDCFQSSGAPIELTLNVPNFDKIQVNERVKLVVKYGNQRKVTIQTGEHLISKVKAIVKDEMLVLTDDNSCNLTRSFNTTTIVVETPILEEIFSYTEQDILSENVLHYPILRLYAITEKGKISGGNFNLKVNCNQLVVQSNSINQFFVEGNVQNAIISFYHGLCSFDGAGLNIQELDCHHTSAHDITVKVTNKLNAQLFSTGNLILLNQPNEINYTEWYSGKVIFQ